MLLYVPAATLVAAATKAESLCRRVRSTEYVELFSEMFTGVPPPEAVKEIPATVTLKESRLVPAGGVKGVAVKVTNTFAVPPPPPVPDFTPLQDPIESAEAKTTSVKNVRRVMVRPTKKCD
jgi:hypothetical protein